MAKKDEELQDLVRGGSANPYGDGSADAFINRRGALQANVDDAKESRKVAWRKSMEKQGYEVDGSDNAYTTSGKFVQSFEGSEKGEALQNQIRKIDWDKEQNKVPQKDPEKGRYSSDVKERTQSFMARMADGHEPTDDEWEGYLRDIEGIYGGVRMPTGEDTTDEDLQEYPEVIQGTSDGVYVANVERAQLNQKQKKEQVELNNKQYLKEVSWDGMNRTYTSDYREAVKNAAGWSRFYDEQEGGRPVERSDVFTIDPATGMPLGVMTRSQRRAWDMQRHFDKYGSGSTTSTEESEEHEWGPGGQPKASDQLKKYKPIETPTKNETNSEVTKKVTENIEKTLNNDDDDDKELL